MVVAVDNFAEAVSHLFSTEGDTFSQVSGDAGGPTKYGVTMAALSSALGRPATPSDVSALTEEGAQSIYRRAFWDDSHLGLVQDENLAIALLDQVVNRGPERAIVDLQLALADFGTPPYSVDGVLGPQTAGLVNECLNLRKLLLLYVMRCQDSYVRIVVGDPTQLKFMGGWVNRTHALMKLGL